MIETALHRPVRIYWVGIAALIAGSMTLLISAVLFYFWERGDREHWEPELTTISEAGQSGWSYTVFSFGMALSAVLLFLNACLFAMFLNVRSHGMWQPCTRRFVVWATVCSAIESNVGMWLVGTFSWSYHGGNSSSAEMNWNIHHLHYVGVFLFLGAALVQAIFCITALAALHRAGSITWPLMLRVTTLGAITAEVSAMGVFISEVFNNDRGGYITMTMSVSEYCVVICLLVVSGSVIWPLRHYSVHVTLTACG